MRTVTIAGVSYPVGTVLEFGGDHPRDGQVWVLTGVAEGPSFTGVAGPGSATDLSAKPDLAAVRAAAVEGAVDFYEVRPRYPPVGEPTVPAAVEGWEGWGEADRLPDFDPSRSRADDEGRRPPVQSREDDADAPADLALAFRLGAYSGAFDRHPEDAIDRLGLPPRATFEADLFSERWLRRRVDDATDDAAIRAAVDRAWAFATATTEECPRVAVPARPNERGLFASVPVVSTRAVGGDGSGDEVSRTGGSPLLVRALRQAWYSPRYDLSLVEADYSSGELTLAVERATETRDVAAEAGDD